MAFRNASPDFTWDLPSGLTAVLAAALCVLPLVGCLLAWHMQLELSSFTRMATVPALVALAACEAYMVRRSPLLFNRLVSGLVGGLAATVAFDLVRLAAIYALHTAPDFIPVIGQQWLGETVGIAPSVKAIALGYGYEYLLVGAMLGGAYSLLVGRGRWHWAAACGLVAGLAFASLPQFQLYSTALGFSPVVAAASYVAAFTVAGSVLGGVVRRLGRTTANAFYVVFLREELVETQALAGSHRA